jgi:hypothetical protein
MKLLRWVCSGLLLGLSSGCGGDAAKTSEEHSPEAASQQTSGASQAAAEPALFDAAGRLLPSGRKLTWFDIPASFMEAGSRDRHHVFRSDRVTIEQLRDYLSARMLTGRVDELGRGALYHQVMPLSADEGAVRFDVLVNTLDGGRAVSLTLEDVSFLGTPKLDAAEAAEILAREQRQAE